MEEKADEAVEEEETDRLATDCRAYTCTVSRLVDLFFIFLSLHFSFFLFGCVWAAVWTADCHSFDCDERFIIREAGSNCDDQPIGVCHVKYHL